VQRDAETTRHPGLTVRDGLTPMQTDQLLQLYRGEWWSRRRSAADVRRILEGSDAVVAVVETDTGALAAFARVLTDGVCLALILDVIVAPRHRGRGVGRLLMDSVLGLPVLRDVVSVELVCQPELVPFYARWGFSGEVGRSRLLRRTADPALRGRRPARRGRGGVSRPHRIRPARPEDLAGLPDIERRAAQRFVGYGLPEVASGDVTAASVLKQAQADGRLWVALTGESAAGFAYATLEGSRAHLEEVDVLPEHGRRGIGAALVRTVLAWARERRSTEITLVTFRDVPWNEPYYGRFGFESLQREELDAELLALLAHDAQRGLDPTRRTVMRLTL